MPPTLSGPPSLADTHTNLSFTSEDLRQRWKKLIDGWYRNPRLPKEWTSPRSKHGNRPIQLARLPPAVPGAAWEAFLSAYKHPAISATGLLEACTPFITSLAQALYRSYADTKTNEHITGVLIERSGSSSSSSAAPFAVPAKPGGGGGGGGINGPGNFTEPPALHIKVVDRAYDKPKTVTTVIFKAPNDLPWLRGKEDDKLLAFCHSQSLRFRKLSLAVFDGKFLYLAHFSPNRDAAWITPLRGARVEEKGAVRTLFGQLFSADSEEEVEEALVPDRDAWQTFLGFMNVAVAATVYGVRFHPPREMATAVDILDTPGGVTVDVKVIYESGEEEIGDGEVTLEGLEQDDDDAFLRSVRTVRRKSSAASRRTQRSRKKRLSVDSRASYPSRRQSRTARTASISRHHHHAKVAKQPKKASMAEPPQSDDSDFESDVPPTPRKKKSAAAAAAAAATKATKVSDKDHEQADVNTAADPGSDSDAPSVASSKHLTRKKRSSLTASVASRSSSSSSALSKQRKAGPGVVGEQGGQNPGAAAVVVVPAPKKHHHHHHHSKAASMVSAAAGSDSGGESDASTVTQRHADKSKSVASLKEKEKKASEASIASASSVTVAAATSPPTPGAQPPMSVKDGRGQQPQAGPESDVLSVMSKKEHHHHHRHDSQKHKSSAAASSVKKTSSLASAAADDKKDGPAPAPAPAPAPDDSDQDGGTNDDLGEEKPVFRKVVYDSDAVSPRTKPEEIKKPEPPRRASEGTRKAKRRASKASKGRKGKSL